MRHGATGRDPANRSSAGWGSRGREFESRQPDHTWGNVRAPGAGVLAACERLRSPRAHLPIALAEPLPIGHHEPRVGSRGASSRPRLWGTWGVSLRSCLDLVARDVRVLDDGQYIEVDATVGVALMGATLLASLFAADVSLRLRRVAPRCRVGRIRRLALTRRVRQIGVRVELRCSAWHWSSWHRSRSRDP